MVIMMVSSNREKAMLRAVRALRRLLRKAFLATKWASIITYAKSDCALNFPLRTDDFPSLGAETTLYPGRFPGFAVWLAESMPPQRTLKRTGNTHREPDLEQPWLQSFHNSLTT